MIADFFAPDYHGGDFVLFGRDHLVALGLIAAICVAVVLLRRRFSARAQRGMRWGLCALIYLCEGSWHAWMLAIGAWTVQGMLPLWLCSVTSWTMPLLLLARSRRYFQWAYFMGLIGAPLALSTPDLMNFGFPHYRFIEFLTLHGALVVAVVYMTAVEGFRPSWRGLLGVVLAANLLFAFCIWLNPLLGSNYLYTQGRLATPSLLDYLGEPPWHLLWMELIGLALCGLLYLPFAAAQRPRK